MPEPDRQYYFDTVTLSNFVLSGRLDLLIARYGRRANITPQVLDEVADGIVAGYASLREVETAVTCGRLSGVERFSPDAIPTGNSCRPSPPRSLVHNKPAVVSLPRTTGPPGVVVSIAGNRRNPEGLCAGWDFVATGGGRRPASDDGCRISLTRRAHQRTRPDCD